SSSRCCGEGDLPPPAWRLDMNQSRVPPRREPGQALIETALVVPILLLLALGVVGVGRVLQAQLAVSAVSREAARAAAVADTATAAESQGHSRGDEVAEGYGLTRGALVLSIDPGSFQRGGRV